MASCSKVVARYSTTVLRVGTIHPVVIDRLLLAASETHTRIDKGGLGGKIVLLP